MNICKITYHFCFLILFCSCMGMDEETANKEYEQVQVLISQDKYDEAIDKYEDIIYWLEEDKRKSAELDLQELRESTSDDYLNQFIEELRPNELITLIDKNDEMIFFKNPRLDSLFKTKMQQLISSNPNIIEETKSEYFKKDCDKEVIQEGRNPPQFENLVGYAYPNAVVDYDLKLKDKVYLYKKIGPTLYDKSNKYIPAKTPIEVASQSLKHRSHGFYSGVLFVTVIDNPYDTLVISMDDFVATDFWNCDITKARKYNKILVEIIKEEPKPINEKGAWVKVQNGLKFECNDIKDGLLKCYNKKHGIIFVSPENVKMLN